MALPAMDLLCRIGITDTILHIMTTTDTILHIMTTTDTILHIMTTTVTITEIRHQSSSSQKSPQL
jgi:hypothetical protein